MGNRLSQVTNQGEERVWNGGERNHEVMEEEEMEMVEEEDEEYSGEAEADRSDQQEPEPRRRKKFKCRVCDVEVFAWDGNKQALFDHALSHSGIDYYKCRSCDESPMKTRPTIMYHYKMIHGETATGYGISYLPLTDQNIREVVGRSFGDQIDLFSKPIKQKGGRRTPKPVRPRIPQGRRSRRTTSSGENSVDQRDG